MLPDVDGGRFPCSFGGTVGGWNAMLRNQDRLSILLVKNGRRKRLP